MTQFGARVPVGSDIGYQVLNLAPQGWARLADLCTIPPGTTGALVYAAGADVQWMQAPEAIPASPAGLVLAAGATITFDDATQVQQLCIFTDTSPILHVQFFTGPVGLLPQISSMGGGGGGTGVQSVTGPQVNNADPANPYIKEPSIPTSGTVWITPSDPLSLPYAPAVGDLAAPFGIVDGLDLIASGPGDLAAAFLTGTYGHDAERIYTDKTIILHLNGSTLAFDNGLIFINCEVSIYGNGIINADITFDNCNVAIIDTVGIDVIHSINSSINANNTLIGYLDATDTTGYIGAVGIRLWAKGFTTIHLLATDQFNPGTAPPNNMIQIDDATCVVTIMGNIRPQSPFKVVSHGTLKVHGIVYWNGVYQMQLYGPSWINHVIPGDTYLLGTLPPVYFSNRLEVSGTIGPFGTAGCIVVQSLPCQLFLNTTAILRTNGTYSITSLVPPDEDLKLFSFYAGATAPALPALTVDGSFIVFPTMP